MIHSNLFKVDSLNKTMKLIRHKHVFIKSIMLVKVIWGSSLVQFLSPLACTSFSITCSLPQSGLFSRFPIGSFLRYAPKILGMNILYRENILFREGLFIYLFTSLEYSRYFYYFKNKILI